MAKSKAKVGNGGDPGGKSPSGQPGTKSPSKKGGGTYPAAKQTNKPVGVSTTGGKGKKPPVTGRAKRGAPKG